MRLGLRARVVAVLAFVSALTLAVAAVTLLSPLEHQLRKSALVSFGQSLHNERGAVEAIPVRHFIDGDPRLLRTARLLARHNGAEVALLTRHGAVLVSTDPDRSDPFTTVPAALRTRRLQRAVIDGDGGAQEAEVSFVLRVRDVDVVVAARKSLDSVHAVGGVVQRAFVVAAAAGLAVALLAGLLLAGRLVRRVRKLRDTALLVAEIGPDVELHPDRGRDEVGELSRAFATMQDRLREQEQARRSFVSTASHELRTPLASLSLMVDNVLSDLSSEPPRTDAAREQAGAAEMQVQRLALLSAELLDLSRIDAGVPLRREPVELSAVLRSVAAEFEVRLREQSRAITLSGDEALLAMGDPGSVAQIVRVLLDNALRHTPEGGSVQASAQLTGGVARVVVQDAGPGVPEADRTRVFERFARGAAATEGGFGLGLAIGRELAQRMDGDLVLVPSDVGAHFELRLPVAGVPGDTP